jgi:ubiquitin carboxyl-terminal hydrolase 7
VCRGNLSLITNNLVEKKLDEEAALREARKKERDEQHLYLNARVITNATYQAHSGTDLATFEDPDKDPAAARIYRLLRASTLQDLTVRVAEDLKQDSRCVRFWCMVNRQNKTIRPDQPLTDPRMTVEDVYIKFSGGKLHELRVWAETTEDVDANGDPLWPNAPTGNPPKTDNILLFLKWFDVENQTLRGAGHIYISKERKVEDLVPPILKKMGWPEKSATGDKTQLRLFEVKKYTACQSLLSLTCDRKLNLKWLM